MDRQTPPTMINTLILDDIREQLTHHSAAIALKQHAF
jgi:hypothetical protein